jgi:hypothetical protein
MAPFRALFVVSFLVCSAGSAEAKKEWKPPKLKRLAPVAAELDAQAPLDEASWKALKFADGCLNDDEIWEAKLNNETTPHQLYEALSFPVICWQDAERKLQKIGAPLAVALPWVSARARYVEGFRAYMAAMEALVDGERKAVCDRLQEATRVAAILQTAAAGLGDRFQTADAKVLAVWLDGESKKLGQTIAADVARQKCE